MSTKSTDRYGGGSDYRLRIVKENDSPHRSSLRSAARADIWVFGALQCLRKSLCGGGKWDVIVLNGPDARGSNADPLKTLLAGPILAANSRRLYV